MRDPRDRKYRQRKAEEQHQHCFYCGFPMWTKQPSRFARRFGISLKEAVRFRCTLEHLVARCDGGTSCLDNIAAACWYCNSHRHMKANAPTAERYREFVRNRVAKSGWHHQHLHKMLMKQHQLQAT